MVVGIRDEAKDGNDFADEGFFEKVFLAFVVDGNLEVAEDFGGEFEVAVFAGDQSNFI